MCVCVCKSEPKKRNKTFRASENYSIRAQIDHLPQNKNTVHSLSYAMDVCMILKEHRATKNLLTKTGVSKRTNERARAR